MALSSFSRLEDGLPDLRLRRGQIVELGTKLFEVRRQTGRRRGVRGFHRRAKIAPVGRALSDHRLQPRHRGQTFTEHRHDLIQILVQLPRLGAQRHQFPHPHRVILQTRHNAPRRDLQRAKRRRVRAGRKRRRHQRHAAQLGREERAETRTLKFSGRTPLPPRLRLRHKGQQQRDGNGRQQTRHQQITPRGMLVEDFWHRQRGQRVRMRGQPRRDGRDENSAQRSERLGPAQHALLALLLGEQFRQPGDGRDEFHAHTNEGRAAEEHEHRQGRGKGRRKWRERVEKNACHHDALASEAVDEPAAEQPEHTAAERGHPEHPAHPGGDLRVIRRELEQFRDGRHAHQRRHQQLIGIEQKTDAGHDDDQPFRQ